MAEKKLNEVIIHCHFGSEPSPELIEALNRMADLAAKNLDKEINNEETVSERNLKVCGDKKKLRRDFINQATKDINGNIF